jgi:hypothetical protein
MAKALRMRAMKTSNTRPVALRGSTKGPLDVQEINVPIVNMSSAVRRELQENPEIPRRSVKD